MVKPRPKPKQSVTPPKSEDYMNDELKKLNPDQIKAFLLILNSDDSLTFDQMVEAAKQSKVKIVKEPGVRRR